MIQQVLWKSLWVVIVFLLSGVVLSSCDRANTDRADKTDEERRTTASSSSPEAPSAPVRKQGRVLAGRELGMVVTGRAGEATARSLDEVEQQLLSFVPQLQTVYDREQGADTGLMGSLDVRLTIEPNGTVSELRFPVKRVSSEKLTTAVYDQMRAWVFSPAASAVDVRYRLLFVPPELEASSVLAWEKQLPSRVAIERNETIVAAASPAPAPVMPEAPLSTPPAPPPAAPVAAPPPPALAVPTEKPPQPKEQREPRDVALAKDPTVQRRDREVLEPLPPRERRPAARLPMWYEVTRPSVLYSAPEVTAEIVTRLPPGKRVWVVRVLSGEWLEVRSVGGRPPGFLPRETARPERGERVRR